MKIALLITGDEILKGDLRDSNGYYLIQQFDQLGLRVDKMLVVGDDLANLITEIRDLAKNFELLIINGGLGPTLDDYTAQALSQALNSALVENQVAKAQVIAALKKRGRKLTNTENKQTLLPKIAKPIFNRVGIAPGIFVKKQNCKIFCTPGVPNELYAMFSDEILPQINKNTSNVTTLLIRCFGAGEAQIQQMITQSLIKFKEQGIKLGFRACFPYVDVKLTQSNQDGLLEAKHRELQILLKNYSIAVKNTTLAEEVVRLLQQKKQKLVFAESCTGGLLTAKIAAVSGASMVLQAGFVLYQNEQKIAHGVSRQALLNGAVSQVVVTQMLLASLTKTNADFGASVSGIAGPLGGSDEKPVGTVWVAWGTKRKINTKCFYIPRDRTTIQNLTAYGVLDLLRRELLGIPQLKFYSFEQQL